jgi:glycosyltransferase involved in cell wall biosynthesis
MNILELCLSSGLGGLELYVYHASNALKKNHKVTVLVLENSKLDNHYRQYSTINRHYLKRSKNPIPIINARKLARLIDNEKIDLIHMHLGKDLPLCAFAKALSKRKPALVYTRHMMITRSKNDFYHNFLYRQIDLMLTITKELELLARSFIPQCANKITTLYTGVKQPEIFLDKNTIKQQRKTLGFSENDFIAGLIGRLEENKGQYLLIDAVHIAKQNKHNIKALIVGHEMKQGYRDRLKARARKLGIAENVKFHDFVSQPQQLMQLCDCVVLATDRETFGLVLPEAMRAGVAVIGSNSGGVPEIINHEKTGVLFETKKAGSLYQQIERLYLNPDFKNKLAQQGKQSADEHFNNELHFKQLEQLLESVIS